MARAIAPASRSKRLEIFAAADGSTYHVQADNRPVTTSATSPTAESDNDRMERSISATRAARSFSDLLNRVRYRGESFVIDRGGESVGRLTPVGASRCTVAELAMHLRTGPKPDPGYWKALAAITRGQPKLPKSPWRR